MCGLFGIFSFSSPVPYPRVVELANANYYRGPLGVGLFEGCLSPKIEKLAYFHGKDWLGQLVGAYNPYYSSNFYLGHCRAPTGGSGTFLHPHTLVGRKGISYFAHNGLIIDLSPLLKYLKGIDPTFTDSLYLHHFLLKQASLKKSLDEVMGELERLKLNGSYSFWWWYDGTLTLCRVQGTLYLSTISDRVTFSSQKIENSILMKDGNYRGFRAGGEVVEGNLKVYNPLR